MKKALHIFRKDTRHQAATLGVWLMLLLLRLRLDTLAIDANGNLGMNALMGAFLTFAGFSMIAVLVAVVAGDPLGNQEAFYRTRPFHPRDIVLAKFLFLLLWITLPVVVFEGIYLFIQQAPLSLIVGSVIERSLIVTLFGLAIAASATTFPSSTAWMRTVLACLPIPWAAAFASFWLREIGGFSMLTPTHTTSPGFVIQLAILASAFSIYAWRSFRKVDSWKRRYAVHALIIATVPLCSLQWQAHLDTSSGEPTSDSERIVAKIDPKRIDVRTYDQTQRADLAQVQVTLTPTVSAPATTSLSWSVSDFGLRDSKARDRVENFRPPMGRLFYFRSNSSNRSKDLSAIATLLPPDMRLLQTFHGQWPPSQTTSSSLSTEKSTVTAEEPVQLQGQLRGRHYSWRQIGELTLTPGATVRDGAEVFRFLGLKRGQQQNFGVSIDWGRPALGLTRNQDFKHHSDDILDRHEFVLIQPEAQIGYVPESSFGQIGNGLLTAYHRSRKTLEFRATRFELTLPPPDPATARLLIFKKVYHGDIILDWQKENIVLANHYSSSGGASMRPPQPISRQEFNRRLDALGEPPVSGSRSEVGRYLYSVIKLVQARDEWIRERDPLARRLAPLAQRYPDMFLSGLKTAQHRASQLLDAVLSHALREEHLPTLLDHLPGQPGLARLIVSRGWHEAAREQLIEMAHERDNLPISAVRAILLLKDESTYAPLLADFSTYPSVAYYEAIRTLPSQAVALDQIVRRLWADRPKMLTHNLSGMHILNIALRHGMQEPVYEIYNILQWIDRDHFSNEYALSRPIQENVFLEGLANHQRNDSDEVFRWMLQQKPEWFHYDPVRRRFIVKKA